MTRNAVIELGALLGLWLASAVILVAGAGLLLWLVALVGAHGLAWVYRCRGYQAGVIRDGIAFRVRRVPRRVEAVTVVACNPYRADGKWRSEQETAEVIR